MSEELDEEQLLEFCQRLGLAEDGYLDEKDLSVVYNCIGLNAPAEMMKELFQELDGDGDGKVSLAELGQLLRGMQSKTSSPHKSRKSASFTEIATSSTANGTTDRDSEFCTLPMSERGAFTILDPQHTGFAKIGNILDLWCQLGISHETGTLILKEMGFPSSSRSNSINLQDLARSIENETDHCKEIGLPPAVQVALVTYRTEAHYLRSVCESMECERDKLKSDIFEAHQRSTMLAQEVDEQNNRLERNTQALLHRTESKYIEQIHELQKRLTGEKEYLQQSLNTVESQLKSFKEEEMKLKSQISSLTQQNSNLEHEMQSLNQEAGNVSHLKQQLKREVARYTELELKLQEFEKKYTEKLSSSERELQRACSEIQSLQDQNDELTSKVESMKETVNTMKATQGKRYSNVKRRKESATRPTSLPFIDGGEQSLDDFNDFPQEKIGKYNPQFELTAFGTLEIDQDDCESSMEHIIGMPSSSPPDSGNFPSNTIISLAACMGESSTDQHDSFSMEARNKVGSLDVDAGSMKVEKLEEQYKTLENEMDSVKEKIVVILSEKDKLVYENKLLRTQLETISRDKPCSSTKTYDAETQTVAGADQIDYNNSNNIGNEVDFRSKVLELQKELESSKSDWKKENEELQNKCSNLENSLELLQVEYEKCEDYWHGKLQEERDTYDLLALKIREYEEMFLQQTESDIDKLSPIEERASLEQQVNEYLEECVDLRKELVSVKLEQETEIENYQRKWEAKTLEFSYLEEQLEAVTKKCHDYESRLSTLAEEERTHMEDTSIVEMLKHRIQQLELSLKERDDKHRQHVNYLDRNWKEREQNLKKSIPEMKKTHLNPPVEMPKVVEVKPLSHSQSLSNQSQQSSHHSKILLEMLHHPQQMSSERIWSKKGLGFGDKSASLPFIPIVDMTYQPNGWGNISPSPSLSQEIWAPSQTPNKKAWCHVELGWLQALRSKLKQREEQCYGLQLALRHREVQSEKLLLELKCQHATENQNWECLVHTQAEKLAHADLLLKDLWLENGKLMAALNATEQRVIQLENLLKFQMSTTNTSSGNMSASNNILTTNAASVIPSSQHSLPHSYNYFSS